MTFSIQKVDLSHMLRLHLPKTESSFLWLEGVAKQLSCSNKVAAARAIVRFSGKYSTCFHVTVDAAHTN